jgi:hypothetical protein
MFFESLQRIKSIATRHSGKTYTPKGLTHLIRCQFQDSKLKFYTFKNEKIKTGQWWIGGAYDLVDDQDDKPCIHIFMSYNPRQKQFKIDDLDWNNFAFHVADVVTHEYLHQYYCRKRDYQFGRGYRTARMGDYDRNMQDYLGCEDELLAYGFSCAAEMIVYNRPFEKTRVHRLYKKHFRQDPKVVLQLKKQSSKYIKQLERMYEQGSPRTTRRHQRHL